jgi:hypothetical protein
MWLPDRPSINPASAVMTTGRRSHLGWVLRSFVLVSLLIVPAHGQSSGGTATITTEGVPVFLLPDPFRVPLANLRAGLTVRVLATEGEWVNIDFPDERFGRRVGYIRKEHLKLEESTATREFDEKLARARAEASQRADGRSTQNAAARPAECRRLDCIPYSVLIRATPPVLVNPRASEGVERTK